MNIFFYFWSVRVFPTWVIKSCRYSVLHTGVMSSFCSSENLIIIALQKRKVNLMPAIPVFWTKNHCVITNQFLFICFFLYFFYFSLSFTLLPGPEGLSCALPRLCHHNVWYPHVLCICFPSKPWRLRCFLFVLILDVFPSFHPIFPRCLLFDFTIPSSFAVLFALFLFFFPSSFLPLPSRRRPSPRLATLSFLSLLTFAFSFSVLPFGNHLHPVLASLLSEIFNLLLLTGRIALVLMKNG